jgi:hypothetical protein
MEMCSYFVARREPVGEIRASYEEACRDELSRAGCDMDTFKLVIDGPKEIGYEKDGEWVVVWPAGYEGTATALRK